MMMMMLLNSQLISILVFFGIFFPAELPVLAHLQPPGQRSAVQRSRHGILVNKTPPLPPRKPRPFHPSLSPPHTHPQPPTESTEILTNTAAAAAAAAAAATTTTTTEIIMIITLVSE